jgi:hypothetical protein
MKQKTQNNFFSVLKVWRKNPVGADEIWKENAGESSVCEFRS